jgi:hypothetical protein
MHGTGRPLGLFATEQRTCRLNGRSLHHVTLQRLHPRHEIIVTNNMDILSTNWQPHHNTLSLTVLSAKKKKPTRGTRERVTIVLVF